MYDVKTKVFWAFCAVAALAILYVLWPNHAGDAAEQQALREGRTVVVYWDRLMGHEHKMRRELIDEFNKSQNEVYVRALPIGYYQAMEKILTSTAAGAPPDICSLDTSLMQQLAPQGVLAPVDDFMKEVPSLAEEHFYPACYAMSKMDGKMWGVPTSADVYILLWNKQLFRKAGLDPERPPQTVEELLDYSAKLTIKAPNGQIEQMGFLPWVPWDLTHLWCSVFGGKFYDPKTGLFELDDDPGVVAGIEFQRSFVEEPGATVQKPWAVDADRVQGFFKGLGEYMSANNPFYTGKVAMITEGEWQPTFVPKYAPNLDWGAAPLPVAPGVGQIGYCPVGMVDCIPATSKNKEAAKKFLRWFYSPRPGGTSPASDYCSAVHNIPTRVAESHQERFQSDPKFKIFVDQMTQAQVATFPNTSSTQFMLDQCELQRERAVFREITSREAATQIETESNKQLQRVRELTERGRKS